MQKWLVANDSYIKTEPKFYYHTHLNWTMNANS